MSALRCQSCEALTTVTWSGRCQSCYRRDFDAPIPIDHLIEKHAEAASATTIVRQARTIRRLFTAYFLAKGQVKNVNACLAFALERHTRLVADVHENVIPDSVRAGCDLERARIVAALRERAEGIRRIVKAMQAVPHPDYRQIEYDQARADGFMSAADTIERGEL